jgi:hypothetical protein
MINLYSILYKLGKTKTISCKIQNEIKLSILSTLFQDIAKMPRHTKYAKGRNRDSIGKKEVKFEDHMILFQKSLRNYKQFQKLSGLQN